MGLHWFITGSLDLQWLTGSLVYWLTGSLPLPLLDHRHWTSGFLYFWNSDFWLCFCNSASFFTFAKFCLLWFCRMPGSAKWYIIYHFNRYYCDCWSFLEKRWFLPNYLATWKIPNTLWSHSCSEHSIRFNCHCSTTGALTASLLRHPQFCSDAIKNLTHISVKSVHRNFFKL